MLHYYEALLLMKSCEQEIQKQAEVHRLLYEAEYMNKNVNRIPDLLKKVRQAAGNLIISLYSKLKKNPDRSKSFKNSASIYSGTSLVLR
jgi:hypothetical protein